MTGVFPFCYNHSETTPNELKLMLCNPTIEYPQEIGENDMNNKEMLSTITEAGECFHLKRSAMLNLAKEAEAAYWCGRFIRIDIPKIRKYLERKRKV